MRLARMDQSPRTLRSKSTTKPLVCAHPSCSRPGLTRTEPGPSLTSHEPFDQGCPEEGHKLLRQTRPPALHSKKQQGRYKEVVLRATVRSSRSAPWWGHSWCCSFPEA